MQLLFTWTSLANYYLAFFFVSLTQAWPRRKIHLFARSWFPPPPPMFKQTHSSFWAVGREKLSSKSSWIFISAFFLWFWFVLLEIDPKVQNGHIRLRCYCLDFVTSLRYGVLDTRFTLQFPMTSKAGRIFQSKPGSKSWEWVADHGFLLAWFSTIERSKKYLLLSLLPMVSILSARSCILNPGTCSPRSRSTCSCSHPTSTFSWCMPCVICMM